MFIRFEGIRENNLKGIDLELHDGLTAVTGVSGSGKSSFVFDTLYRESRRRFLEAFGSGNAAAGIVPAKVASIRGMYPSVALTQNSENRNPASTIATATGIHPFLRILYARFGERRCPVCGEPVRVFSRDGIAAELEKLSKTGKLEVFAPLVRKVPGRHRTLVGMLREELPDESIFIDGKPGARGTEDEETGGGGCTAQEAHDIDILIGTYSPGTTGLYRAVSEGFAWGVPFLRVRSDGGEYAFARDSICTRCDARLPEPEPKHFNDRCSGCGGSGCDACDGSGLNPAAASVFIGGRNLPSFLSFECREALSELDAWKVPEAAARLRYEIRQRLESVVKCGLGYASLDRPVPSLSRGEGQRLRLAVILRSPLDDMLHILDEPTIGLHRADIANFLPVLRELPGPVVFVEHDAGAVASADRVLEFGPGAGTAGGGIVFDGTPEELWKADTPSGMFFSGRGTVIAAESDSRPGRTRSCGDVFRFEGAGARNLKGFDFELVRGGLNVICGVSGSGKSTLAEEVVVASLTSGVSRGCRAFSGPAAEVILVDQSPIGRNPRSNPATYTKLADSVRDLFALRTGLPASCFSFNRPDGACAECGGTGAIEVAMNFLAPAWIPCEACGGRRFKKEILDRTVVIGGTAFDIASFLSLPSGEARVFVESDREIPEPLRRQMVRALEALTDIGLGYLCLDQPSPTLSGGEAQRVKLAKFLGRPHASKTMLVLDEPTSGLHPSDVSRLLTVLGKLCREGTTVTVVEHDPDVIRASDRILELGPGSGPDGGFLLFQGTFGELSRRGGTPTSDCLSKGVPVPSPSGRVRTSSETIRIRGARANNLQAVDLDLERGKIHAVTGLSGSGKSSLIRDVLEAEARARFLESISSFERQNARDRERGEADRIEGLGLAVSVCGDRFPFGRRATVGTVTGLTRSAAILLSVLGHAKCPGCSGVMKRIANGFVCSSCGAVRPAPDPSMFLPATYGAACATCHGLGTLQKPCPEKLIIRPEKPLLSGAMYSPGFFPNGYLGKPGNGGYDMVTAFAAKHRFDPFETPWNALPGEVRTAFLYGESEPMEVTFVSRSGRKHTGMHRFPGFYGWIGDWDTGGTYTTRVPCPSCGGARLRDEYLAFALSGKNAFELETMQLSDLGELLDGIVSGPHPRTHAADTRGSVQEHGVNGSASGPGAADESGESAKVIRAARKRIDFLERAGLGYICLSREASTLSAGEAQRVRLAGLLGSELSGITVILDEPTRGMHPGEVDGLISCIRELRDEGNTVILSEHDPAVILAADTVWDLGPGAGKNGGKVVATGTPEEIMKSGTVTGRSLASAVARLSVTSSPGTGDGGFVPTADRTAGTGTYPNGEIPGTGRPAARIPERWMTLRGARGNNLRIDELEIPLGVLCGVLGVSGSGKSTLVVDTLGRILAPRSHTTSVAREPLEPEPFDRLDGRPAGTVIVDQSGIGGTSPAAFLGVEKRLRDIFSLRAEELGFDPEESLRPCGSCGGSGEIRIDLGFLSSVREPCETCDGSGYSSENRRITVDGLSIAGCLALTLEELLPRFRNDARLHAVLGAAISCRLGYLTAKQHGLSLSGGEKRRLKIAAALAGGGAKDTLFILDEPTAGLHLDDIDSLAGVLEALVIAGNSCIVVEHSMSLLSRCDWLIELGPGGGPGGGRVVFSGTPGDLASGSTPSSRYLSEALS